MHTTRLTNAMTIDVEDYFQVSAFAPYIARTEWDNRECRVERNIQTILEMLARHYTHATFFTLGWIAERYPQLVRQIVNNGHELASHGYGHQRASEQSPEDFFNDIDRAKKLLEDLSGQHILGYRAPSFSIGKGNLWAYDALLEAGYHYSSSIYPIAHDHYGMPDSPRFAYEVRPGLTEIPITTVRLFERNFPSSGGGYFRLLPYPVTRWLIQRVNTRDQQPGMFYFHPWEIDPDQPRVQGINHKAKFRHYVNLAQTQARLDRLLSDFTWGRVDQVFMNQIAPLPLAA
jgi:polysaccharide deacetylase family protein (PEP-CTERM system associated)